jgi:hypothetical protein
MNAAILWLITVSKPKMELLLVVDVTVRCGPETSGCAGWSIMPRRVMLYFSGVVSRLCICSLHAVVAVLFHARLNIHAVSIVSSFKTNKTYLVLLLIVSSNFRSSAQNAHLGFQKISSLHIFTLMAPGSATRPCAFGTRFFGFITSQNGPLRALPLPSQLRCFSLQRKSVKNPGLGKSTRKVLLFLIVQQCNCRWHCESAVQQILQRIIPSHPLSLQPIPFQSLPI